MSGSPRRRPTSSPTRGWACPLAEPAQRVVVDYSGPNVAKELHAGHLRADRGRRRDRPGAGVSRAQRHPRRAPGRLGHPVRHAHRARARHRRAGHGQPARVRRVHRLLPGRARPSSTPRPTSPTGPASASWSCRPATSRRMRLWQLLVDDSMEYLRDVYARLDITLTDADMAPESFYNSMLADVCAELAEQGHRGDQRRRAVRVPAGLHRPGRQAGAADAAQERRRLRLRQHGRGGDQVPAVRPATPTGSSTWSAPSSTSTCRWSSTWPGRPAG